MDTALPFNGHRDLKYTLLNFRAIWKVGEVAYTAEKEKSLDVHIAASGISPCTIYGHPTDSFSSWLLIARSH